MSYKHLSPEQLVLSMSESELLELLSEIGLTASQASAERLCSLVRQTNNLEVAMMIFENRTRDRHAA